MMSTAVTFFGINCVWSKDMGNLINENKNLGIYNKLEIVLNWMIWIRLWYIFGMMYIMAMVAFHFLFGKCSENTEAEERVRHLERQSTIKRMMELRMQFEFRARSFDPKLDIREIDCAICLDPLDSPDGKRVVPL